MKIIFSQISKFAGFIDWFYKQKSLDLKRLKYLRKV